MAALAVGVVWLGIASASERGVSTGPDVIVGDLYETRYWGVVGDIAGYSVGTVSCNVGDEPLPWEANNTNHPVIAQNMYRLKEGRFEQIGMSWLKHGFAALTEDLCDDCQNPLDNQKLGVGCSDPYTAGLNGDQAGFTGGIPTGGLGPRSEVNATTGSFTFPGYLAQGVDGNEIYKRLQVATADLDPTENAGALYFVEGHYITAADSAAGNDANNVSYRQVSVNGNGTLSFEAPTVRELPAIHAWQEADPDVWLDAIDVPSDGRYTLAAKATDQGGGTWHYEYALYNMNSDRGAVGLTLPVPSAAVARNFEFHDVHYHSGEPWAGTDWLAMVDADAVQWAAQLSAVEADVNALRWGTLYNFSFDADLSPGVGSAEITLFKAGTPGTVGLSTVVPVSLLFADGFESGNTVAWGGSR